MPVTGVLVSIDKLEGYVERSCSQREFTRRYGQKAPHEWIMAPTVSFTLYL